MPEPIHLHPYPEEALAPFREAFTDAAVETAVGPSELLESICWRESRAGRLLTPPGPEGLGDNGHGHGLMQIDDHAHAEWLAKVDANGVPLWKKAAANIMKGAEILRDAIAAFDGDLELGLAHYNASAERINKFLDSGRSADEATTGGNYVAEVIANAKIWHLEHISGVLCCACTLCTYLVQKEKTV